MKKINAFVGQVPEKFTQKKTPKIPLLIAALLVGVTGAYLLIHSFAATDLVADNGFESGNLSGWNIAGVGDVVPTVVSDIVHSGSKSGKFVLTGSQGRSELILGGTGTSDPEGSIRFTEGEDYYYGFSFYIQSMVYGRPGAHNLIMQLKGADSGSPAFGLQLWDYEGDDGVSGGKGLWSHGTGSGGDRFLSPVSERQWHDIVVHFKVSKNGTGSYQTYLDGKLVDSRNNTSTIPAAAPYAYIKSGLYRNGGTIPGTSDIRLDDARLGTSLSAVSPGTTPSPPSAPPADTTAPTVSVTAPAAGATVSGSNVTVSAAASDNMGISGVQFKLDGNNLNSEELNSPYAVTWNTTTASNGTHTLTAVARDAAGNTKTSNPTTVTVNNSTTPSPAPGSVLFKSDFESGTFTGWYVQSLPGRATILPNGAFQGSKAARFEVRQGDVEPDTGSSRSEVSGPTFDDGQDIYVRDAIRIPDNVSFSGPWQIIQQLHDDPWSGSPGIAVFLRSTPSLTIGAGDGSPTYWNSSTLQKNRWYDLVYRVKLSQNASVGFVEVWLDGVPQTLTNGQKRMNGQTVQAAHTYLKAGIYRSRESTGTSFIDHDNILVGTSFEAVSPPGTTPAPTPNPTPPPDTTVPTVSLTAPANNATVSGIVTATASASDNVGVAKVDFFLDGALKMSDTAALYNYSFDSKTLSNGNHTLTAKAYDVVDNNSTSTVTVKVNNPDVTAPNAPTNLKATATQATAVNLSWTASTDTGANQTGVAKYNVLRNGIVIAQPTTASYTDTTVVASKAYTYVVQAIDGAGNVSANSNTAAITTPTVPDTVPPSVPANLNASAISADQVNLSWGASTDGGGSGIAGYNVYRGGTKLNSAPINGTTYGDSTVSASTSYTYKVETVDGAGNKSAQSGPATVTTPAASDTITPSVPTGLRAVNVTSRQVDLSWDASTDKGGSGVAGYIIYRNDRRLNSSPVTDTSYSDSSVSYRTTYRYKVRAIDGAGNRSARSDSIRVSTPRASRNGTSVSVTSTTSTAQSTDQPAGSSDSGVAITVTGRKNKPIKDATVVINGQTAKTDENGTVRFDGVPPGRYTMAVSYNGKNVSKDVHVKGATIEKTPETFSVAVSQDRFNPALLLIPVAVLLVAGGFFVRPWQRFVPSSSEAAAEQVVTSNRPPATTERPGHKLEKPGTVYQPKDPHKHPE